MPLTHSGLCHLQETANGSHGGVRASSICADEGGLFDRAGLLQPVGQGEARRVLLGFCADRGEESVVVVHRKKGLQNNAVAKALSESTLNAWPNRLGSQSHRQVQAHEPFQV